MNNTTLNYYTYNETGYINTSDAKQHTQTTKVCVLIVTLVKTLLMNETLTVTFFKDILFTGGPLFLRDLNSL